MSELVNLNTASAEELTSLPGVGPAIAERILAARPFDALEDVQRVAGIGSTFVKRITPLVTLELDILAEEAEAEPLEEAASPLEEQPAPDDVEQETVSLGADEAVPEEDLSPVRETEPLEIKAEVVEAKKPAKSKTVTRGQALAMSLLSGFIAFVLALFLTLGILAGINGGLRFVRLNQLVEFGRQIEVLNEQVIVLAQDVGALRERLSHLEGIGERVDQLGGDVARVQQQTEALVSEMSDLRNETVEFQRFLDGLRELLNAIQKPKTP